MTKQKKVLSPQDIVYFVYYALATGTDTVWLSDPAGTSYSIEKVYYCDPDIVFDVICWKDATRRSLVLPFDEEYNIVRCRKNRELKISLPGYLGEDSFTITKSS